MEPDKSCCDTSQKRGRNFAMQGVRSSIQCLALHFVNNFNELASIQIYSLANDVGRNMNMIWIFMGACGYLFWWIGRPELCF